MEERKKLGCCGGGEIEGCETFESIYLFLATHTSQSQHTHPYIPSHTHPHIIHLRPSQTSTTKPTMGACKSQHRGYIGIKWRGQGY